MPFLRATLACAILLAAGSAPAAEYASLPGGRFASVLPADAKGGDIVVAPFALRRELLPNLVAPIIVAILALIYMFLIAHFQKAALLMFSDRLVDALEGLDVGDADSVKRFKRSIRRSFEGFLRFTHRYWFHELSERPHVQTMYRLCSNHLHNDAMYDDVRDEIREMSHYLDSDSQRRQSNTVVRLTVITILGLIATVTTGYFGMNIIAFGEGPAGERLLHGLIATGIALAIIAAVKGVGTKLSGTFSSISGSLK